MIMGAALAGTLFGVLSIWEAAILAIIIAPTDASLGAAVVNNEKVPKNIRQALNVESGVNDGLAFPFLLGAIIFATAESTVAAESPIFTLFFTFLTEQVVLGIVVGVVVGILGAKLIPMLVRNSWMDKYYAKISMVFMVAFAYFVAERFGGNGFIATFCMGITFNKMMSSDHKKELFEHLNIEVDMLMMITYLIFGAVMLPKALTNLNATYIIFAVLALVLTRPLAVYASFARTKTDNVTKGFVGWFGPRGIASILYIFEVLEESAHIQGTPIIYNAVMITVLLSVFAHGITAAPLSKIYGNYSKKLKLG